MSAAAEDLPARVGGVAGPRDTVHVGASVLDWMPVAAVAILILAAVLKLAIWTASEPVSFDGAMNLDVARSLAEGRGYRRMYGDHLGFSHAIQTRAPYILPAALVFAAFGVGVWQAQLVNALHLVALALLAFVLVRRAASWRWGLAAVALCLCTPGLEDNGLNGYGEVPALTWWLAALAVLYGGEGATSLRRCFAAGVLVGIAVVTKTVLLIGAGALVAVLAVEIALRERRVRPIVIALAVLCLGALLPVLLHEASRALAFGDVGRWKAWVRDEWRMIHMQAGTEPGLPDSVDVASKVHTHFGVLVEGLGTAHGIVAAWLLLPALLLAASARRWMRDRARPIVMTLALCASIYLVWWLGVTPTEKAWYRRIFNGVLVWELMAIVLIALLCRSWATLALRARVASGVAAALSLVVGAALASASFRPSGLPSGAPGRALADELAAVGRLPPDAPLYGIGWYSMPSIALYAGRHVDDLNDTTSAGLAARAPVFLMLDKAARIAGVETYWLQRYPNRLLADIDDFRLIELDTARASDPFAAVPIDPARVRPYADFHVGEYPYVFGFYGHEGDGWRWARSDVEALLAYGGEDMLQIDLYVPKARYYRGGRLPSIAASIDGCALAPVAPTGEGRVALRTPVGACAPAAGARVRVRLVSDAVDASNDGRQLSYVTHGFGFVAGSAPAQPR